LKQEFYSHGKLLLTAEYLVLDGANALAFPTKYGQSLIFDNGKKNTIAWKSYDHNGKLWLDFCFTIEEHRPHTRS
jgi:mevalonate kinase